MSHITNCCVRIDSAVNASSVTTPRPQAAIWPPRSQLQDALAPDRDSLKSHEKIFNIIDYCGHFRELVESLERLPQGLAALAGVEGPLTDLANDSGDAHLMSMVKDSPMFRTNVADPQEELHEAVDLTEAADPTDANEDDTTNVDPPLAEAVQTEVQQALLVPSMTSGQLVQVADDHPPPSAPAANILQFSTSVYYCKEGIDLHAVIDVMRLGSTPDTCSCYYKSLNASAKHGVRHWNQEGKLTFEKGEFMKDVKVPIVQDEKWGATLEFTMQLSDPQGATLGKYLHTCRVKVMDDDLFPTNKFRDYFDSHASVHKIPKPQLLVEYFKMNLLDPTVRKGTIMYCILSQVRNMYFILQLYLTKELVDSIVADPNSESYKGCREDDRLMLVFECPVTPGEKEVALMIWAFLLIVPFSFVHFFDYRHVFWKLGGTSRTTLQLNLLRKFFNYSESVRNGLDHSEIMEAITRTSPELVEYGFMQLLPLSCAISRMGLVIAVQLSLKAEKSILPVLLFPLILLLFLRLRSKETHRSVKAELTEKVGLLGAVDYCIAKFRILTDYAMRWQALESFEHRLAAYNRLAAVASGVAMNNKYAAPWLSVIFVGGWYIVGGNDVVNGGASLGFFLMIARILNEVGDCWSNVYEIGLTMQNAFVPLREISFLMNLPTDLEDRMRLNRKRRAKGEEARKKTRSNCATSSSSSSAYVTDMIPLSVQDLSYRYLAGPRSTASLPLALDCISLDITQGTLVALIGESGQGKSTLLKILGGVLLPESGDLLIPPHLRVLHISQQPMFIDGTLYENLTFGIKAKDPDAAPERAMGICRQLNLPESICAHFDAKNEAKFHQKSLWDDVLSLTECTLLNLARAFMCNPEVLIVHKPTMMLNERLAESTIKCLRNFVDQKGLMQDPAAIGKRRPRTCIMTASRIAGVKAANQVIEIKKTGAISHDPQEYVDNHMKGEGKLFG